MRYWVPALALLALSACEKPEDMLENSIRTELSKQGDVRQVEMRADGDDRLDGFAIVAGPQGDKRLNCKATREGAAEYQWECNQVIDETVLKGMEDSLRQQFEAKQVTVEEIDMQPDGDDKMKGYAVLSDGESRARLDCSATRTGTTFQGECHLPEGEAGGAS